jgi:hypothetical protein
MPEQTQAKQASLADEVDALLGAMQQTCDRLESQLAETPAEPDIALDGPVADEGVAAVEELTEQVDAMVREVSSAVAAVPAEPTHADDPAETDPSAEPEAASAETAAIAHERLREPSSVDEPTESVAKVAAVGAAPAEASTPAVTDVIGSNPSQADATEEPRAEASSVEEALPAEPVIEQTVDQTLAPQTETDEAPAAAARSDGGEAFGEEQAATEEDELASLTDELLGGQPTANPAAAPAAVAEVRSAAVASAPVAAVISTVAAAATPASDPVAPRVAMGARVRRHLGEAGDRIRRAVEPAALRLAAKVSAPILAQPKSVRDTIGWFAAYSLFVGATVAGWAFLVHTPAAPAPADPGVRLADEHAPEGAGGHVVRRGLPREEPRLGDSHAAQGDGHAEKADDSKKQSASYGSSKKSDAKKSDAKKAPAKKSDSGHGGH